MRVGFGIALFSRELFSFSTFQCRNCSIIIHRFYLFLHVSAELHEQLITLIILTDVD